MSTTPVRPKRKSTALSSYAEPEDFVPEIYVPRQKIVRVARTGRSGSAPPIVTEDGDEVLVYLSRVPTPPYHAYVADIAGHTDWNDVSKRAIRLAYAGLNPEEPTEIQGVYITDPCITGHTCTELPKHFEKLRADMMANIKKTSATEATGEAAAAFAVCKSLAGFTMKWGAHVHCGPGLDQIWHKATPADPSHPKGVYLIVEGKGVGASTNTTTFGPPPEVQNQMSIGWVYHNLCTMVRNNYQAAIDLVKDVGLAEELKSGAAFYANYGGVSKSYYKCQYDSTKQKASLKGLVVQAKWTPAGALSYTTTEYDYH